MTESVKPFHLPRHKQLGEPRLKFGRQDSNAFDVHPLRGLLDHGPFSQLRLAGVPNPIKIAFIGQEAMIGRLRHLATELQGRHEPKERRQFLIPYPGFTRVFGASIAPADRSTWITLPKEIDDQVTESDAPHRELADVLTSALSSLVAHRHSFDVVILGLDEKWSNAFSGDDHDDFDLHDYLKAYAASAGISLQIVRGGQSQRALDYFCRCSVMWRLSIAIYTKAGGIPWALADTVPNTAYIGIDYALRPNAGPTERFAICCAQVFDSDGAGLEFVAYEADDIRIERRNPYMREDQMLRVISRSLSIYQRRHAGSVPDRVVVHKNTEFRRDEIKGCLSALSSVRDVELLQVQRRHGWQGVIFDQPKSANRYPSLRGQVLPVGENEALLWTQGLVASIGSPPGYYKEGKGIPQPLLITRFSGRGDFFDLCRETLALTKMNWNNDGPYTQMPVTLEYADTLAQIVKRMPKLEARPYPVRLFM